MKENALCNCVYELKISLDSNKRKSSVVEVGWSFLRLHFRQRNMLPATDRKCIRLRCPVLQS